MLLRATGKKPNEHFGQPNASPNKGLGQSHRALDQVGSSELCTAWGKVAGKK